MPQMREIITDACMEGRSVIPYRHRVLTPLPPHLVLVRLRDCPVQCIQEYATDIGFKTDEGLGEVLVDVEGFPACDWVGAHYGVLRRFVR